MRHFQASFYPLQRAEPGAASDGVGMVIADVTATKRAERLTKEGEERFRTLVEASAAIIWTADGAGAFVEPQPHWNRFTGQTTEEAMGWGRLASVHADDVERIRTVWRNAVETRTPIAVESRLRRHDGKFRYMALSVAPVLREDGTIREWVGSHTDITERKEDEALLSAAKDARRGRKPRQERVPGQHEPRASDTPVGRDRLQRDDGGGGRGHGPAGPVDRSRQDQVQRPPPAEA